MGKTAHHNQCNKKNNGPDHLSSRALKMKRKAAGKGILQYHYLDDKIVLKVSLSHAEDIDNPSHSTVCITDRFYQAVVWVEPRKVYRSKAVHGLPNPDWDTKCEILLEASLLGRGHLHVEVLRIRDKSEPGTSKGIAVVSRVRIPLPKVMDKKKGGRFGLVRNEGPLVKAEGHIILSMEVIKLEEDLTD